MASNLETIQNMLSKNNKNKFNELKKCEKKIVGYLEIIRSDYIAFANGLSSAVFVKEILDIPRKRIIENSADFFLSLVNTLLAGLVCFFLLRLLISYKGLQSIFTSIPTQEARYNAIFTSFEKTKYNITSISRNLRWIQLLVLLAFLLNVLYFFYINHLFLLLFAQHYFFLLFGVVE